MLSQHSAVDGKLHPCAFSPRHLSATETNYDVGNWELLAIIVGVEALAGGFHTTIPCLN